MVQELAKIIGQELKVFNVSQSTDTVDLLGGYKPVDLKSQMKDIYAKFLPLFWTVFSGFENKDFYEKLQVSFEDVNISAFKVLIDHGSNCIWRKLKNTKNEEFESFEIYYNKTPLPESQKTPVFTF